MLVVLGCGRRALLWMFAVSRVSAVLLADLDLGKLGNFISIRLGIFRLGTFLLPLGLSFASFWNRAICEKKGK